MTNDEVQEYVLTEIEKYCVRVAENIAAQDDHAVAAKTNMNVAAIAELRKRLSSAWRMESTRVRDRIMLLRNGKR